jgi:hypothetical protein
MRYVHKIPMLGVTTLLALLAGCETTPSATESDFGRSVREMVSAQVSDPAAGTAPSTAPAPSPDNDSVNAAIGEMRKEVGVRSDVDQPIVINVGGASK